MKVTLKLWSDPKVQWTYTLAHIVQPLTLVPDPTTLPSDFPLPDLT